MAPEAISDCDEMVIINSGPGNRFVYEGKPGNWTLIASHCPNGPATDGYGNDCPQGDWCDSRYGLVRMTEVWPGVMLRRLS